MIQGPQLLHYFDVSRWPTTTGTVVVSEVVGERAFRPSITIQYNVGNQPYTTITDLGMAGFGTRSNRRDAAERLISQYSVGKEVVVHYDSHSPQEAHLQTTPPWNILMQFSLGAFLVVVGAGFLLVHLRQGMRKPGEIRTS